MIPNIYFLMNEMIYFGKNNDFLNKFPLFGI